MEVGGQARNWAKVCLWKKKLDVLAERVSLRGFDGKEHTRRMEMRVYGHVAEGQLNGWIELSRKEGC